MANVPFISGDKVRYTGALAQHMDRCGVVEKVDTMGDDAAYRYRVHVLLDARMGQESEALHAPEWCWEFVAPCKDTSTMIDEGCPNHPNREPIRTASELHGDPVAPPGYSLVKIEPDGKMTHWARKKTQQAMEGGYKAQAENLRYAIDTMVRLSHGTSVTSGWHTPGKPRDPGNMIALMHSELSEALEGLRKGLMDDHLPKRPAVEVELADLMHRVFDFAGKYDLDLGGAYVEKGLYNLTREDHKPENRAKPGGKKF